MTDGAGQSKSMLPHPPRWYIHYCVIGSVKTSKLTACTTNLACSTCMNVHARAPRRAESSQSKSRSCTDESQYLTRLPIAPGALKSCQMLFCPVAIVSALQPATALAPGDRSAPC
jgi:hypothetical protein